MTEEASVLIVDDDDDIRCNMRDILADLGYRVDIAHDGQSALQLVRENTYDVALLDIKMPRMDGATLYSEIKKLRPVIVAIMVTAYAGSGGADKAREAGTWKILRKPVDAARLLPLVEQITHEPVILVVDDDPDFCENLWQLLRDRQYRVRIAHTEEAGLESAEHTDYDVALVDLRLGRGNGQNVVTKIREANPSARIIVATGFPESLKDPQADVVLQKPVDVEALLSEIQRS